MGFDREAVHAAHRARLERLQRTYEDQMEQAKINRNLHKQKFEEQRGAIEVVKIVSSMKDVKSAVEDSNEAIKTLGSIMKVVADGITGMSLSKESKQGEISEQARPSNDSWSKLDVTVSERDYRGNIKKLEVTKL